MNDHVCRFDLQIIPDPCRLVRFLSCMRVEIFARAPNVMEVPPALRARVDLPRSPASAQGGRSWRSTISEGDGRCTDLQ